jgi:hypothetical protein
LWLEGGSVRAIKRKNPLAENPSNREITFMIADKKAACHQLGPVLIKVGELALLAFQFIKRIPIKRRS